MGFLVEKIDDRLAGELIVKVLGALNDKPKHLIKNNFGPYEGYEQLYFENKSAMDLRLKRLRDTNPGAMFYGWGEANNV